MPTTKIFIQFSAVLIVLLSLVGCGKTSSTLSPTPQAIGSLNRIAIVTDQNIWDTPVQDSIRFYLGAAYPVLPQPEPLFDIQHYTTESMEEYPDRYRFKNIIFLANMSRQNSKTTQRVQQIIGEDNVKKMMASPEKADIKVTKNVWATGQTIFFVYGENNEALFDEVKRKSGSIAKLARENDQKLLRERVFRRGRNEGTMRDIKDVLGIDVTIPEGYKTAISIKEGEEPFIWIRETDPASHVHSNIMMTAVPFKSDAQFTQDGVKYLRDKLGKKYITSTVENSFMRINDFHLPLFSEMDLLDESPTLKVYGIWEMSELKDMMGGAFVSYLVHDKAQERLILLDGFTFAPGKKKREMMQSIEMILSTIKLNK